MLVWNLWHNCVIQFQGPFFPFFYYYFLKTEFEVPIYHDLVYVFLLFNLKLVAKDIFNSSHEVHGFSLIIDKVPILLLDLVSDS